MSAPEIISKNITAILEIARMSPSVHNTQPWIVSFESDTVHISIDPAYELHDGDPTGRQTIISLGIFAEAVAIVSEAYGLRAINVDYKNKSATISFTTAKKKAITKTLSAMLSRTTDRSIYRHIDIKSRDGISIIRSSRGLGAKVWLVKDEEKIKQIADLTAKGIGLALSNPNFRQELSKFLVNPWSGKKRGISTSSLYIPKLLAALEPVFMRVGLGLGAEVQLEKKRWESASGIVFITTEGDMPDYWFEAGRAYMHVTLKIEELGLSQATSAATVEASNYHEDVEQILHTTQRLQSVIRIGKGADRRNHSPRVSVESLLT